MAARNADLILTQDREKVKQEELRTIGAIDQVGQWIGIGGIRRVEAYDISNTSGVESVGSMVVYEDGKPKRSDYHKFKDPYSQGPNDYASMEEVLTRRFSHGIQESKDLQEEGKDISYGSFTVFLDPIMMDGGRGQVNIALSVLERLGAFLFLYAVW